MYRCDAIVRVDYRRERAEIRCNRPATWHSPAGVQVREAWLCDQHRAEFVEACSTWCHRDGWRMPEPIEPTPPASAPGTPASTAAG